MKTILVGETKIEIRAIGCTDYGTAESDEWFEAGTVGLSVAGIQRTPIQLWRCEKCNAGRKVEVTPRCVVHRTMLAANGVCTTCQELEQQAGVA